MNHTADVLVIGSGAAGLTLALGIADKAKVIVLSKENACAGSTNYAQGGIAGVYNIKDDDDSIAAHVKDTCIAGGFLCDEKTVDYVAKNAHDAIQWLIDAGVPFDTKEEAVGEDQSPYHLHREGGHSHRRIFHAEDHTGKSIQETLVERAKEHKNITLLEGYNAIDLITTRKLGLVGNKVVGAYVLNTKTNHVETIKANFIALCTGGASKVYQYTCNPEVSSGDGIAMAYRAGCRVANMETKEIVPTDGRCKKLSPYLSEAEREKIKSDKPIEFMQTLFTNEDTPMETHKSNPDVVGASKSLNPQSIVDALKQLTAVLEDMREDLSAIRSRMV